MDSFATVCSRNCTVFLMCSKEDNHFILHFNDKCYSEQKDGLLRVQTLTSSTDTKEKNSVQKSNYACLLSPNLYRIVIN